MAFNTGNAVGSTDPRDLSDNAENLDRFANGTNAAYDDRLGVSRKSLAGMESDFATDQSERATTFANFLASSGYVGTGTGGAIEDYAGGIEITEYNQLIRESGEFYRAKASLSLPYTTTGTWVGDDETRFVSVGDAALRQEIGSGIFRADSLANLESTPGRFDGDAARLVSGTGRDGDFRWDSSDLSATLVLASATSDSVDDTTDTINDADHPFSDGDGVITQTTVNGLTAHTVYWVVNSTSGTYQLSATFGGGAVDLTGTTNVTIDKLLDPRQGVWVTPSSDKTGASGAWIRSENVSISPGMVGASGGPNEREFLVSSMALASLLGLGHTLDSNLTVEETVEVPPGLFFDCGAYFIEAANGFAAETAILKFGDFANGQRWEGALGGINVEAHGQRVIGVEFDFPWHYVPTGRVVSKGSTFKGVLASNGGGLSIPFLSVPMSNTVDGYAGVADSDSVGIDFSASDNQVARAIVFGAAIGVRDGGGNNEFISTHVWSTYDPMIYRAMKIGFWLAGQNSKVIGGFVDGLSLEDIGAAASESNGGYAYYVPASGDGFQVGLHGCRNFVPDRTVFGETLPVDKLVSVFAGKRLSNINVETVDQTGAAIADYLDGPQKTLVSSMDQRLVQFYSADQIDFRRGAYLRRGIEFNTEFFDAPEQDSTFGSTRLYQEGSKWLHIRVNQGGNIRDIRLEMRQKGDATLKSTLEGELGPADEGYRFYQTDVGPRLIIWDGAAFRDTSGALA